MRVLVVVAHPDDEVLGCGGVIIRHTDRGDRVHVLVLGEGVTSRSESREQAPPQEIETLRTQSRMAAAILGVAQLVLRDLPDNRFDSLPLLDIVKEVERVRDEFQPEVVYTHHWGDLNIDHRLTCQAVMTAFRPHGGDKVRELLAFEVPSSTGWGYPSPDAAFVPNYFVDVSGTIERKIEAMLAYQSEVRPSPHPRSIEAMRALAEYRGAWAGLEFGEAFVLLRGVR